MSTNLYSKIPDLLDRINYQEIQSVMKLLNWTWFSTGTPTIDDLRSTASYLLHKAVELFEESGRPANGMVCATGGFEARVDVRSSGEVQLNILFYVCSHSSN